MNTLTLIRDTPSKYLEIFGMLYINDVLVCCTLENKSYCIPTGEYSVEITYSPTFKRLMPLVNVPDRSGIRFHTGNDVHDTIGCILVGMYRRYNNLLESRTAFQKLWILIMEKLKIDSDLRLIVK